MKRLICLVIFIVILNDSCKKKPDEIHFHGRIILNCNSQFPVGNQIITIGRYYDIGHQEFEIIGSTTTDNDGYYSADFDVNQKGALLRYKFIISDSAITHHRQYSLGMVNSNSTTDVETNGEAGPGKVYRFHIKNTSPFSNGDVFNSFIINHGNQQDVEISNLTGINVDRTIYLCSIFGFSYNYSFTKNGIITATQDSIPVVPNCLDTTNVDIFY